MFVPFYTKGLSLKKGLVASLFVFTIFALVSCENPSTPPAVFTASWVADGSGKTRFATNDVARYSISFFKTVSASYENPANKLITIGATKISGAASYGYGAIFNGTENADGTYNAYRVLLTKNGNYRIDRANSSTYTTLKDWTFSSAIYNDGRENIIKIIPGLSGGTITGYTINVNETNLYTFTNPTLISGEAGFYTSIGTSASESFPGTPVDTRYRMVTPVTSP